MATADWACGGLSLRPVVRGFGPGLVGGKLVGWVRAGYVGDERLRARFRLVLGCSDGNAEAAETRQVGGCCEECEVCVDSGQATNSCLTAAVSSPHEMPDLTFDFGPGRPVVLNPCLCLLPEPGRGQ